MRITLGEFGVKGRRAEEEEEQSNCFPSPPKRRRRAIRKCFESIPNQQARHSRDLQFASCRDYQDSIRVIEVGGFLPGLETFRMRLRSTSLHLEGKSEEIFKISYLK